jgi:hypothetical protein
MRSTPTTPYQPLSVLTKPTAVISATVAAR